MMTITQRDMVQQMADDLWKEGLPFRQFFGAVKELKAQYPGFEFVYIAGKMRGLPEFNFPAFFSAERELRKQNKITFNPARWDLENNFDPKGMTGNEDLAELGFCLRTAIGEDLVWICAAADVIHRIDGWVTSSGATAESYVGQAIGIALLGG